nr:hypothetical protein [Tanacetum cinerariifolium]
MKLSSVNRWHKNIDFSSSDQIQTPQKATDLIPSLGKKIAIQYSKPEDPNELFQKLLEDLKELAEYKNSQKIAVSNSNKEKEGPSQESEIRHLIREECCVKASEEKKQSMEDTMLELVKICRQKEFLCIHDNVEDLIESALNTKLFSINSQRLDNKEQEVKNVVEQPAKRGNHTEKSLQNFRVIHKSSISFKNTSQISPVHAVAPILSTKEPEYSPSMGYEHSNTTPKIESDEIIKSHVEELVPILSENEVTSEDKKECDVPDFENSPICDDHYEIFSDSNNDNEILVYDDDFEDIEYVEASLSDPEIENDVEEEEVDLEDISQIQDIDIHEKLLSITRLIANIKSLNDNPIPDRELNSSVSIPIFKESDNSLSNNFSPEFETFCDHTEETRSGITTIHVDNSLPDYDSFCFEIEPDQERLINVMKNDIFDDSSRDVCFLEELLIDDSIRSHESSDSNFEDNPSIPRPPPKPPDAETDAGEEIPVTFLLALVKKGWKGTDQPPKVLRRDHADPQPTGSTHGGKSLVAIELGMASTLPVPVPESALADVSDPDPLSFADPRSRHPADGTAAAGDPKSENASFASVVGPPESIYRPEYGVAKGSMLDTPEACQDLVDHVAPPGYFSELRHLHNDDFLRQYNINLARQVVMGSQLRLREHEIKNLEALLEAEADMKKATEEKNAKLSQELENMRALFSDLQEFKQYEDNRVEQRCAEMDARLDALSVIFDEELYPHMLTAIAGRRWMIGRGLRLAVMKCGESLELRQAFADVVSAGIAKGMSEGLRHGGLKDAPMDVIMAVLHLESDTGDDVPQQVRDLRPSSSQLTILLYPEVRNPMNPWAYKEDMLLADAIAANVSRAEKKKKCRVVCRTHGVGSAHHARSDGVPVSVSTVVPQGLAILLADAATQTEPDEATLDNL